MSISYTPPHNSFQYDFFGSIYAKDSVDVGTYHFPQLQKESFLPDADVLSINYLLSVSNPKDFWFHCFCDDSQFSRLWTNFYYYKPVLQKARGIISTDFSLYRDYSEDLLRWNCYRNRVMAFAFQQANINTIPTAGFGPEFTWGWCFDGLPHHSTVAITTNGVLSDPEARRIFAGGVDALVRTLQPSAIVVCGKCPEWLDTKYPDIQIIHIPSYSQQWRARRCA